jgi:flagellar motor component MotA
MILGGDLSMFANLPSLLVVIPPAIFATLAATSKQARSNAWSLLFSEAIELDTSKLKAAKQVFTILGNMSMLMGFIGVVINAVAMASNIEPETFSGVFGSAFAVCLLTLFYALLIKALCYAAEAKIQSKIIEQES